MKFVTYRRHQDAAQVGILHDGLIIDLELLGIVVGIDFPATMLEFIDLGEPALRSVKAAIGELSDAELSECAFPSTNASLLAPIPRPRKNIIGIGLNYTDHVAESARTLDTSDALPKQPVIFSKPPTAVTAWNMPIEHNAKITQRLDWECELAVIIGRTARHVSEGSALDYVFGYSVINDVSARDCRRAGQWIVSKGQNTFAPMGPCIVTKDDIPNPHNLSLKTRVNGVEKQNGNSKSMLFNINQLIADISTVMTLEPGDIIATGTPAGVGAGQDPQEWMWPGDVVECEIVGIGTLRNPIVAV